jgi:sarcosine oxidase
MGSSHGLTRIIRLAYYEHPSYVPLLRRAFELWRDLESRTSEKLLHVTGAIDAGPPGARVFEGSRLSCELHELRHEILTSAQLRKRFPAYRLPAHYLAVFQPDGGFLLPERCIQAHLSLARAAGAEIRLGIRALSWEPTSHGVVVRADNMMFEAAQMVVCAGAWTSQLVPELSSLLTPERQVLGWFEVSDHALFAPDRFPVFVMNTEEGHYYGFPEFGVPGFKLGKYHHLGGQTDPDSVDRAIRPADEAALRGFAKRCFPAGTGRTLMAKVCMFTNTPDEHFIIDRLPSSPQALVVSACSGHGFKFCSVIGEIVADLVERDATVHEIGWLKLKDRNWE